MAGINNKKQSHRFSEKTCLEAKVATKIALFSLTRRVSFYKLLNVKQ
jgi:hypothetical protein